MLRHFDLRCVRHWLGHELDHAFRARAKNGSQHSKRRPVEDDVGIEEQDHFSLGLQEISAWPHHMYIRSRPPVFTIGVTDVVGSPVVVAVVVAVVAVVVVVVVGVVVAVVVVAVVVVVGVVVLVVHVYQIKSTRLHDWSSRQV